jgi:hypothetical protein
LWSPLVSPERSIATQKFTRLDKGLKDAAALESKEAQRDLEVYLAGRSTNDHGVKDSTLFRKEGCEGEVEIDDQHTSLITVAAYNTKNSDPETVAAAIATVKLQQTRLELTAAAEEKAPVEAEQPAEDQQATLVGEDEDAGAGKPAAAGGNAAGDGDDGDDGKKKDSHAADDPENVDEEDEEKEDEEEGVDDETPEGKELRLKSEEARLQDIRKVKLEGAGEAEDPGSESEEEEEPTQSPERSVWEAREAKARAQKAAKLGEAPADLTTPQQAVRHKLESESESSSADEEVKPRHPQKQNLLKNLGATQAAAKKKRKQDMIDMFGEDSEDHPEHGLLEEEDCSQSKATATESNLTAVEQGAIQLVTTYFEHQLLIVTNKQPPRAVMATQPSWVLLLRRIKVAGCSDDYCNLLFKELNKHRLVHCSFNGLTDSLSDEALDSIICLLDSGCMSLVIHVQ